MCGIVGFIDPNAQTPHPESVLMKMRESISHRGPDQAGLWSDGPAYLGHRRLAIVDPGPSGQQPFVEDGIVAVANGEIYNHQALRERYAQGKTVPASDCAILPSVYRKEGADVDPARVHLCSIAPERWATQVDRGLTGDVNLRSGQSAHAPRLPPF